MSFSMRNTNDLIAIAKAGGGFTLSASMRNTNDLIAIAKAASTSGAQIKFTGLNMRTTNDLISIANAGGGNVHFVGE